MAVTSCIIQTLEGRLAAVRQALSRRPDCSVLRWENPGCLVVVTECPAAGLEALMGELAATPGVVSLTIAYCSIEDELDAAATAAR